MSLAKKSIKWLIATIVVFAMVLTAVFAANTVASASAEGENTLDVVIVAYEDVVSSSFPNYLSGATNTIKAEYYFAMTDEGSLPEVWAAPVLVLPNGDEVLPASFEVNTAYAEHVTVEFDDAYLDGDTYGVRLILNTPAGEDISYFAGVDANHEATGNYLFYVTYELEGNESAGQYAFGFSTDEDALNQIAPDSDDVYYTPDIVSSTAFFIRQTVQVPTAKDDLVYNGGSQIGVDDTVYYTAGANDGKINANTELVPNYTLTLTLTNTNIYCWADDYSIAPKEIDWVIAPKDASIEFTNAGDLSEVYNEEITVFPSFAVDGLIDDTDLGTITVLGTPEQGDPVGTYPLTFSYTANSNYNVDEDAANYYITKRSVTIPVVADNGNSFVYDRNEHSVIFTDAYEADAAYITFTNEAKVNVGNYTATAALSDPDNTQWAGGTSVEPIDYGFAITVRQVPVPVVTQSTFTYDGDPHSIIFATPIADSDYITIAEVSRTDIGSDNVAVSLKAQDGENVAWAAALPTYTLTINPMTIKVPVVATSTYTYDRAYHHIEFTDYHTSDAAYIAIDEVSEKDYQEGGYEVTASLNNPNTVWADTEDTVAKVYTLTINKKAVVAPTVTLAEYEYDTQSHTISYTDSNDANYYTITSVAKTAKGVYVDNDTVALKAQDAGNVVWSDTETAADKKFTLTITAKKITKPTAKDKTYTYNEDEQTFEFENTTDSAWYTVSNDTRTLPGTQTVTVALTDKDNTVWAYEAPAVPSTADLTFEFEIEYATIDVILTYSFDNEVVEIGARSVQVPSTIEAVPELRFFDTFGFTFGNNVVTEYVLDMDGETINAPYFFNVGTGDSDGDGVITTADILLMVQSVFSKNGIAGRTTIEEVAEAWEARLEEGNYLFKAQMDVNGLGDGVKSNDVVAVREALATGYDYSIVADYFEYNMTAQNVKKLLGRKHVGIENATAEQHAQEYAKLVAYVKAGYPVDIDHDIDAATEDFDLEIDLPADIYFGTSRLTVNKFSLTTDKADVTLKITAITANPGAENEKTGTLYTVEGITISAPNGNVKVAGLNGYSYEGTSVNLAAYSNSLHIDGNVAFFLYHIVDTLDQHVSVADFKQQVSNAAVDLIETANERIAATAQKMAEIAAIKNNTDLSEAEKAEQINDKEVKKAIISVPLDTHVVVEEQAVLSVEKIEVVAASDENSASTTFTINVKNDNEEAKVAVDITIKDSNEDYVVEAVTVSGTASNVEIIKDQEQEVAVTNYVAQIGTTGYETLQAAITAAQSGDTIKLLANVEDGTGITTKDAQPRNFTIDFNGKTYKVVGPGVGSTGTETQAMHWSEGSVVTLKNGTFVITTQAATVPAANGKLIKMAMQNYANLTVKNMTMDFSNIVVRNYGTYTGKDAPYSGLEIPLFNLNAGSMTIENTTITMPNDSTKGVLIEIPDAATIKNSTINGYVSLGQLTSNVTIVDSTVTGGVVSYFAGYGVKHSGNVYRLGGVSVTNYTELQAALNAGAIIIDIENDFNAPSPIAVSKSTIINGYDHTITSAGNRIMNVTEADLVITINDLTLTSATSERGLNIWDSATGCDITLNNVYIDAHLYAINYVNGADDEMLTVNNSYLKGWGAINAHFNDSAVEVNDSTLYGINRTSDHTYGFSTVVIDGDSLHGAVEGDHGVNNTFVFDGCTIIAEVRDTHQYWISFQYAAMGNTATVVVNDCEILDGVNGNDKTYDMLIEGTNNAVVLALDATQYAQVAAQHYTIVDNGNGTYSVSAATANIDYFGSAYNFYNVFENGWLEDTEAFTLTDDVVLDTDVVFAENRAAAIAVSGGTFTMNLDGYTISGEGKILLPVGVTCVTDSDVSIAGIFEAPEGEVIIESVDADGNYIYAVSRAYVKTRTEFNNAITAGAKEIVVCAKIALSQLLYQADRDILIDLNGNEITLNMTAGIRNSSTHVMTIVDSSENGTGKITSTSNYGVYNYSTGTINVFGGTISAKTSAAVMNGGAGTINIYGGSFTTVNAGKYAILSHSTATGEINVYGGTFTADVAASVDSGAGAGTGTINIYGGTFSADPSDFVASGYMAVEDEGTWTVVEAEITITTFAELKAAIADVNAGNIVYPTLIIANDIQFEEELTISKSVYIMGDGEVKFIGYDASTKYDEAFYINVADEDQEITIDGIVFDHFCYYSNVANKTKATSSAVKNGVAYITYGGDCPASTTLYVTGCQFIGTARDMINASSTKGCKGYIIIEDCYFDATDRLSSTLNMLSFYGNADAELSVMITGCTFKEASEQNATWATSAIASFGNADITVVGCEFIACQIGIAIDNTFDRLYSTSTYPVYYNTTVTLVENTYTNCYFGYYGEFFVEDVSEIPEEAELYTDEPFTYGDAEATQFHFAAEYDLVVGGTQGVDAKYLVLACYYVLA